MPELGPQNRSPGRKFDVESDFHVKNKQFRRPEAKSQENLTLKISENLKKKLKNTRVNFPIFWPLDAGIAYF